MSSGSPRPVALDHNFPKTLLRPLAKFIPEVTLHWVADIDRCLADLHDDELVYELHRRGFSVLATGDHHMVRDVRVLVALEQTRMSLLTAERIGDDAVFATGVLLRDLLPLLRNDHPQGLIYIARPTKVRGTRSRKLLAKLIEDEDVSPADLVREHGLPYSKRRKYDPDDPRHVS